MSHFFSRVDIEHPEMSFEDTNYADDQANSSNENIDYAPDGHEEQHGENN